MVKPGVVAKHALRSRLQNPVHEADNPERTLPRQGASWGPMRINLIFKMIILSGLGLMFGIALLSIFGIVSAREHYRDQVVAEVARSTSGSQTITGPLLVVALDESPPAEGANFGPNLKARSRNEVVLLPETLLVRTSVRVEERYRGIYKVPVYRSTHRITGVFHVPPRLGLPPSRDLSGAEPALLVFGVGDARGMRRPPEVRWNGAFASLNPGTGLSWLSNGFSAPAGPLASERELRLPFEIDVELVGTDRLALVPVGASSQAVMESNWPHPGFTGGFLPDERTVGPKGFRASWLLSRYATGVDDAIRQLRQGTRASLEGCDFGVRFVTPVDVYQQSERAVKYGMLFVALTFLVFFLFEVLKRLAIHPIQYGLAGAALAVFFLLLVSLSEHLPFLNAYVIASGACVGLLAFYVGHVLGSVVRGSLFAALLAGLYAVLYLLLQSEDYALLLGSLFLFAVLAAVMVMTRRVDWYRVGEAGTP